jgi:hypothetical protein
VQHAMIQSKNKNSMEILVKRLYKTSAYTIGKMYIDGQYLCDTVEDCDRGLKQSMTSQQIAVKKVYGKTAIPAGRYKVTLTFSNKFKRVLPLVNDVIGFLGIRIHAGNTADDSLGCIIVGENKIKGGVVNSKVTLERLMAKLIGQTNILLTIE